MITQELTEYVRGELAKGRSRDEIRTALLAGGGWGETDVDEAFRAVAPIGSVNLENPNVFPPLEIKPKEQTAVVEPVAQAEREVNIQAPAVSTAQAIKFEPPKQEPKTLEAILQPQKMEPVHLDPTVKKTSNFPWKTLVLAFIIGALGFCLWYFYRPQMGNMNNIIPKVSSFFSSLPGKFMSIFPKNNADTIPIAQAPIVSPSKPMVATLEVKNCGTTKAPELKAPLVYEKDPALSCIGEAAVNCMPATVTLSGTLFPTNFTIVKNGNSCNFKLSYPLDSTLVDISNNKLAGRAIECPVAIVKAVDQNVDQNLVFNPPALENKSKYAAQIYFYGTIGVFIENNLDITKINNAGCTGEYIKSVFDSYSVVSKKP